MTVPVGRSPRWLPDTSCIVAVVCAWHERHEAVARELERRLSAGERLVVAGPSLVESYAVLTRLPAPHRLAAADARDLLEANFLKGSLLATLSADEYRAVIRRAPEDGVAGGQTYDATIAACARKARVAALLTLNARHFPEALVGDIRVIVPGERAG
jgi:predicted nucleic acid-binding protein